jgi:RNA polymerase sigma factor (sigma-70 family)
MTEDVAGLYRSLSERLEHIVRIDVSEAPDAVVEDACQFAWDRLVFHRARVRPDTVLPWLARIAVREALRLLGRERRFLSLDQTLELAGEVALARESPGADELFETRELLRATSELPDRQQQIVWLRALGLGYVEIALHAGCTTRTVERQLIRARRALRAAAA